VSKIICITDKLHYIMGRMKHYIAEDTGMVLDHMKYPC